MRGWARLLSLSLTRDGRKVELLLLQEGLVQWGSPARAASPAWVSLCSQERRGTGTSSTPTSVEKDPLHPLGCLGGKPGPRAPPREPLLTGLGSRADTAHPRWFFPSAAALRVFPHCNPAAHSHHQGHPAAPAAAAEFCVTFSLPPGICPSAAPANFTILRGTGGLLPSLAHTCLSNQGR